MGTTTDGPKVPGSLIPLMDHIRRECDRLDVTLRLVPESHVLMSNGGKCQGLFDPEQREISVAVGRPARLWVPVLIHESCHMHQWSEQSRPWMAMSGPPEAWDVIDQWLVDETYHPEQGSIGGAITRARNLELDCERRSVVQMARWEVGLDIVDYTRWSNAYIFFFEVMRRHRVWMKLGRLNWNNRAIMDACPTKFLTHAQYRRIEDHPELYRQLILNSERIG